MIEFKKNVGQVLPYDRQDYIKFLNDEFHSIKWYGISFQLDRQDKKNSVSEFVVTYERLFKNVVLKLDNNSYWIVNHDDKDLKWFPNNENNLISLRTLFKQSNIPNTFKGALLFKKEDLLKYSKELISYPFAIFNEDTFFYKNLDISHGELQFIMKISSHFNIDLLSTNQLLLREVVQGVTSNIFNIKKYRDTSL